MRSGTLATLIYAVHVELAYPQFYVIREKWYCSLKPDGWTNRIKVTWAGDAWWWCYAGSRGLTVGWECCAPWTGLSTGVGYSSVSMLASLAVVFGRAAAGLCRTLAETPG